MKRQKVDDDRELCIQQVSRWEAVREWEGQARDGNGIYSGWNSDAQTSPSSAGLRLVRYTAGTKNNLLQAHWN